MPSSAIVNCARSLANRNLKIAFAESATAGRAASEFALTNESGRILKRGLVCYDACIKEDLLGIPKSFVEKFSPESAEVTREMARQLYKIVESDIYLAITGLTTPGGSESPEKPVGTMFTHIVFRTKERALRKVYSGHSEKIMLQAIEALAAEISDMIEVM